MADFLKQLGCTLAAGFAGACCLGATAALSVLSAAGAGFLINDAFLIPAFYGLMALSAWLTYRTARHRGLAPFWLAAGGAFVYAGLAAMVAGSIRDYARGRAPGSEPGA